MKKSDLVRAIALKSGVDKIHVESVLASLSAVIHENIADDEIIIADVVKISSRLKVESRARNPSTGETIMVPEHRAVKFKVSSVLKNKLKGLK